MKKIILLFVILTAGANEISIEEYLQLVEKQNLDIEISKDRLASLSSRAHIIGIPAPMFSFVNQKIQGTSSTGYELSQDIPNPLRLSNEKEERNVDSLIESANSVKIKREIKSIAKFLYLKYAILKQKVEQIEHKKNILQTYKNKLQSAYRTDYTFKLNTLKIEGDNELLSNELDKSSALLDEIKIEMASLINLPKLNFEPKVLLPEIQDLNETSVVTQSSLINMKSLQLKNYENKEKSVDKLWRPDFNLKFKSMASSSMSPASSEFTVGLTLPFVFPWDVNSELDSIRSERRIQASDLSKEKRNLENKIAIQKIKLNSLKKQIERLDKTIIPNVMKRKNIMDQVALRELESFQMKYEAMLSLSDFKIQKLELRLQYEEIITEILRDTHLND